LWRNSNISLDCRNEKRRLLRCAFLGFVLVCFANSAGALDPRRMITQYMREYWGSDRGFSGQTVTSFAQSSDGYLWIGTEKGLVRFDGLNFRLFQQATPESLTIGPVQGLLADAEGNLWVLLQNTKILRYQDGKFELSRGETEFGVTAIGRRTNGAALFFSLNLGIVTFASGRFQAVSQLAADGRNSVVAGTGESAVPCRGCSHFFSETNSAVISMAETSDGKVWLGTRDKGLFYVVDGRLFPLGRELHRAKITCLLPLPDNELWIGTENGVLAWDGAKLSPSGVPATLRHIPVHVMMRDRDANIWLGTDHGLLRVNASGISSVAQGGSASSGPITALFEDREGNLWVGNPTGIERLRDGAFVTYSVGALQSESGGPVYVDEEGRTWFAPFEGGLQWLKDGKTGAVTNDGLNQDVVYSITGSKDDLWIGRQRGGLTHLRYDRGSISTKTYTKADGLPENGVYAVYEANDGTVWAATLGGELSAYRSGHFTQYTTANRIAPGMVLSIAESPDGTMWFGTANGLEALSRGHWHAFTVRDGLPSNEVDCALSDSAGALWIGTAAGLAFLRSDRVESLSTAPAALQEPILGMAEGQRGQLWIATSNHVLSARRDRLLNGSVGDSDIRIYGLEDGLRGTEGVKRERSIFRDPFGKIWFSMNRGLSVIDTTRVLGTSPPTLVQIDTVSVDGTPLNPNSSVSVPPGSHRIMFNYSGLSLSVPERVRFKYKLEGYDLNWSESGPSREAVYTNLDSGNYRFRLIASNSDGLWNSAESSLPVEVQRFFWKTWWFRISGTLLIVLTLFAYLRMRTQRLTRQMDMRFEERLAERTRIARELHDSLLQGFQGLLYRLQAARELLPDRPQDAAQALDVALDRGDQAIAEGRSTIKDLRDSMLRDNDIVEDLISLGEELCVSKNGMTSAPLRVFVEGKPRELAPIIRDEIYQIAREALRNALQHAHADKIEAEVTYGETLFSLRVRDDGKGIDQGVFEAGKRSGHWGLPGMYERAKALGAQFHVWSERRAGTEIELNVPSSIAYQGSSSRFKFWFPRKDTRGSNGRSS
jgi:signal transduction histidine kinase/ligand-binding sensor domain-containing protein